MLCFGGYMYVKKKVSGLNVRWQCTMQRNQGCSGCVTTDVNPLGTNPRNLKDHNHNPSDAEVEVASVRSNI